LHQPRQRVHGRHVNIAGRLRQAPRRSLASVRAIR
jgi:hypothetical protein